MLKSKKLFSTHLVRTRNPATVLCSYHEHGEKTHRNEAYSDVLVFHRNPTWSPQEECGSVLTNFIVFVAWYKISHLQLDCQYLIQSNKNASSQERQKYGYESSEKPQTQTSIKTDLFNWSIPANFLLLCYSVIGPASRNRQECHLLESPWMSLTVWKLLTLSPTILKKGVSFSLFQIYYLPLCCTFAFWLNYSFLR